MAPADVMASWQGFARGTYLDTLPRGACICIGLRAVESAPERGERLDQKMGELDSGAFQAVAHSVCERVEGERFGKKRRAPLLFMREDIVGITGYIQDREARMPTVARRVRRPPAGSCVCPLSP